MNQTLKYCAVVAAFAAATFAFIESNTIAGALAAVAGVLVGVTIIRKEER
ncbi:hypothetical protein [Leucobacter sp.]